MIGRIGHLPIPISVLGLVVRRGDTKRASEFREEWYVSFFGGLVISSAPACSAWLVVAVFSHGLVPVGVFVTTAA